MGWSLTALTMPFEGLPGWVSAFFYVAFVVIIAMFVWTSILFAASVERFGPRPSRARRRRTSSCGCSSCQRLTRR